MPERAVKDQEEEGPKQVSLCWFVRPCRLGASGVNLCPPGAFGLRISLRLSLVLRLFCFALLCFVFRLYAFVDAAALRSIVLRYAGAPIATRACFFGRCRFSRVFFVSFPLSLCMESTSYVLSFRMVFFYLVTTGWIFYSSLCENLINQSINQ